MRHLFSRGVLLAVLIASATPAHATPITLEWEGTITSYHPFPWTARFADVAPVGTAFAMTIAYDDTATNLCLKQLGADYSSQPRYSGFYQGGPASLTILGREYRSNTYLEIDAPDGNCWDPPPDPPIAGAILRFPSAWMPVVPSADYHDLDLLMGLSGMAAVSAFYGAKPGDIPTGLTDAIPSHFVAGVFAADGTLSPVPEPGTLVLLGSALTLAAVRRWRRR